MGKIATRIEKHWQSVRYEQERAAMAAEEQVRSARATIIAAKMAYRIESDRWLCLLSKAVSAIEDCPEPMRTSLNRELLCLSACAVYPLH